MKAYVIVRYLTAPLHIFTSKIPASASVLDWGCGVGVVSALLAAESPDRSILAFDPDPEKIKVARQLQAHFPNLILQTGYKPKVKPHQKFDAVIVSDVLYLLPRAEKFRILQQIKQFLKPTGQLIIKTTDKRATLGFALTYAQELISVFLTKKTFSSHQTLFFLTQSQYQQLLAKAGFKLIEMNSIPHWSYHTHCLIVAKLDLENSRNSRKAN